MRATLPASSLAQTRERNRDLIDHSQPVMEYLFEQVRYSHSMVVLADRHGVLMHTLGDSGFVNKAERVVLTTGASWHEQDRGTNAIGTALAEATRGRNPRCRALPRAQRHPDLRRCANCVGAGRVAGRYRHLGRPAQPPCAHLGFGQHRRADD